MASIQDLPVEIVVYFLQYLDSCDIPVAKLTCRQWYIILTTHNFFTEKTTLHLKNCTLQNVDPPIVSIVDNGRVFNRMLLANVTLKSAPSFWSHLGPSLTQITLDGCILISAHLFDACEHLHQLQTLIIKNSRFTESSPQARNKFELFRLKSLTLRSVYLYDSILLEIQSIFTCVESLKLNYSSFENRGRSLLQYLASITGTLSGLNLSYTKVNSDFVQNMLKIQNLNLRKLTLKSCYDIKHFDIITIVQAQKSITHLNLDNIFSLPDETLVQISTNLPGLKRIKIHIGKTSNFYHKFLSNLKTLNYLKLSNNDYSLGNTDFGPYENKSLEKLYVSAGNFQRSMLPRFFENCPNIKSLTLYQCSYQNQNDLQSAFYYLKDLQNLNLQRTFTLSDSFFNNQVSSSSSQMYIEDPRFTPITNCAKLKYLNLSRCRDLSDATMRVLKLKKLKKVDLRGINITSEGIYRLVSACPLIEEVNVDNCRRMDDEAIKYMTEKLRNLRVLNVEGCQWLTDKTIEYITRNCSRLNCLNIMNTRISPEARQRLYLMRNLKHIYL